MRVVLDHSEATIIGLAALPRQPVGRRLPLQIRPPVMHAPRRFAIVGVTADGRTFRPSDWAERLAGTLSCFRPGSSGNRISDSIGYSPYCVPDTVDGHKAVIVNEALREVELMAWDFVMNFARDNQLTLKELPPAG